MIEAQIIDDIVEELSASEKAFEHTLDLMNVQQPVLLGYLFSETFEAFTQTEREYLLFLTGVLWKSVFNVFGEKSEVTEDQISAAEDRNWNLIAEAKGKSFNDKVAVFFDQSKEEELLAFLEDALEEDAESPVTAEGREPLFITLKSILDCLVAN